MHQIFYFSIQLFSNRSISALSFLEKQSIVNVLSEKGLKDMSWLMILHQPPGYGMRIFLCLIVLIRSSRFFFPLVWCFLRQSQSQPRVIELAALWLGWLVRVDTHLITKEPFGDWRQWRCLLVSWWLHHDGVNVAISTLNLESVQYRTHIHLQWFDRTSGQCWALGEGQVWG